MAFVALLLLLLLLFYAPLVFFGGIILTKPIKNDGVDVIHTIVFMLMYT